MPELTPAQRTSTTARYLLIAGFLLSTAAVFHVSVTATLLAMPLILLGAALWAAARCAG